MKDFVLFDSFMNLYEPYIYICLALCAGQIKLVVISKVINCYTVQWLGTQSHLLVSCDDRGTKTKQKKANSNNNNRKSLSVVSLLKETKLFTFFFTANAYYIHGLNCSTRNGVAYLCGHLHTLGDFMPKMYSRQKTGTLELELGDWKISRM